MSKIWICQGFRDRRIEERNRNSKTRNRSTGFRTRNSSLEDRGRRRGQHGSATLEATKCKGFIFFYRVFQRNKTKKLITLLRLSYFFIVSSVTSFLDDPKSLRNYQADFVQMFFRNFFPNNSRRWPLRSTHSCPATREGWKRYTRNCRWPTGMNSSHNILFNSVTLSWKDNLVLLKLFNNKFVIKGYNNELVTNLRRLVLSKFVVMLWFSFIIFHITKVFLITGG